MHLVPCHGPFQGPRTPHPFRIMCFLVASVCRTLAFPVGTHRALLTFTDDHHFSQSAFNIYVPQIVMYYLYAYYTVESGIKQLKYYSLPQLQCVAQTFNCLIPLKLSYFRGSHLCFFDLHVFYFFLRLVIFFSH